MSVNSIREALDYLAENGITFDEKMLSNIIRFDPMEHLKDLHKRMDEYWQYLHECTYHPYDTIMNFSVELREIIDKLEKNNN